MKKKMLILGVVLFVLAMPVMADSFGSGKDLGDGYTKSGVILGNGIMATIGFDFQKAGELNLFAGAGWNFQSFRVGANYLFTLADIKIEKEVLPLSFGPQASIGWQFWPYGFGYAGMFVDLLAVVRWEYTFPIPLNVFFEFGAGVGLNFGDYYYTTTSNLFVDFAWTAGLGVRYVLGK